MVRWYSFLNQKGKENLTDIEQIQDNDLIICSHIDYRKFAKFGNHIEFKKYREKIPEKYNCFYETILEDKRRKPYFDIDINIESDIDFEYIVLIKTPDLKSFDFEYIEKDIVEEIKNSIIKLVENAVIVVYSSHTKNKLSFHIIVSNYYFTNHNECKEFYKKVVEDIKEEYREYIDETVYKNTQQFRILGSHKNGKDNTKIFREDLSRNFVIPEQYRRFEEGKENFLLFTSLIGSTDGCKYLEGYKIIEEVKERLLEHGFASSSDVEEILNIFYSQFSANNFKYCDCKDNDGNLLLTFRRINPSFCKECVRVHEHENPFITVNGLYRNIFFHCRRNDSGVKIGSLGPEIINDITIEDIPKIIVPLSEDEEEDIPVFGMSIIDRMKKLNTKPKKPKAEILTDFLKI